MAQQSYQAGFFRIVIVAICWYRIVDIVQNIINRLIFAPLRGLGQNRMASSVRTLRGDRLFRALMRVSTAEAQQPERVSLLVHRISQL